MMDLMSLPRVSLGVFPTPIQRLDNISRDLGTNVFVKRDDLTGVGLGGNKVRKLEYLLADARNQGAEIVFTTGGAQSNHAMLTAACALKLGMNETLTGATLYSFGTSLPELAIALGAVLKHQEDVTLGEIYASNIFTGLAVMGALCLVAPLPVEPLIVGRDLPLLVLAGVLMQMFVTSGGRFVRSEAVAIIALYALFLAAQFGGFAISLP